MKSAPIFTNLGMHFIKVSTGVVLVQVEVNVRGLLAVHARRLCKSKRSIATASSGTVRLSIATPESQEIAHSAISLQHPAAEETWALLNQHIDQLRTQVRTLEAKTLRQCTPWEPARLIFQAS